MQQIFERLKSQFMAYGVRGVWIIQQRRVCVIYSFVTCVGMKKELSCCAVFDASHAHHTEDMINSPGFPLPHRPWASNQHPAHLQCPLAGDLTRSAQNHTSSIPHGRLSCKRDANARLCDLQVTRRWN